MTLDDARRFLAALRQGDQKAIAEMRARFTNLCRLECRHCGQILAPRYNFVEMVVESQCPECGREVRLPIQDWDAAGPLQPPPAS